MTLPLFLLDASRLAGAQAVGSRVVLAGPEGRHAAVVRRLSVGEQLDLADGAGLVLRCVVRAPVVGGLELEVLEARQDPPAQPRLVVVQALAKGDRGELAVEVMTEVGVDVIVPWEASRCVVQWRGERGARSLARWRSTAREAAKQARRPRAPEVTEPRGTRAVSALMAGAGLAAVLHEEAAHPLSAVDVPRDGDVVLCVGPEGGITAEELAAFGAAGASAYVLGPSVLRTSTAGAAGLAVLLSRTTRWA